MTLVTTGGTSSSSSGSSLSTRHRVSPAALTVSVPVHPEDVGGVHGYANFLDIIANPDNPEYRDTKRWVGGHFDPEWFDREMTDKDVRNALRANRRIRLRQPRPKTPTRPS